MKTAADILNAAANLIETRKAIFPSSAILLAVQAIDQVQPGQPLRLTLYEQAINALAARLGYRRGRRPSLFLTRWTKQHTRDELVDALRGAAVDTSEHVAVVDAVRQVAAELDIREPEAASLLIASGIPPFTIEGRLRLSRTDVAAYAAHLAGQARTTQDGVR